MTPLRRIIHAKAAVNAALKIKTCTRVRFFLNRAKMELTKAGEAQLMRRALKRELELIAAK